MLNVSREDLLGSKGALEALGKTYCPVGKENYWFVKKLKKIHMAMKREGKLATLESNKLVNEFGTIQLNQQKGIDHKDTEAMEKYSSAMQEFHDKMVQVDIEPFTLTQLKEAQVTLQVADQMSLMWMLSDE